MVERPSQAARARTKTKWKEHEEKLARGTFPTSIPRERPSWWIPEKVLEAIEGGEHPILVCSRASSDTGGRVTVRVLRADISKWSESASWGEQFQAAIRLHPRSVSKSAGRRLTKKWYPAFFAAMEREDVGGRIALACHFADVGPEVVYALRDRRNASYDAKFDERCRILEGRRFSEIRENFLDEARSDAKIAALALESGMPSLHGKSTKLEVTGQVVVDHRLPPEVVEAARTRQRTLLEGRQRALPSAAAERPYVGGRSEPVIDVEYAEVRKGARGRHS